MKVSDYACDHITLLKEFKEEERVYGRLPHRLWLVIFNNAGTDNPMAILDEYDDARGVTEQEDRARPKKQITAETLSFWRAARRRVGDW